jgi:hypothetical protein
MEIGPLCPRLGEGLDHHRRASQDCAPLLRSNTRYHESTRCRTADPASNIARSKPRHRRGAARWWILFSLLMIVCEGLASMLYFWPRNEIMFVEGPGVHSAEYLKQVAREFETWHWRSRLGFNALAAVTAFVGFLGLYRHRLVSQDAPGEKA